MSIIIDGKSRSAHHEVVELVLSLQGSVEGLEAEVARLTALLKECDDERLALKSRYLSLTAERDGLAKALDLFLDRPPGASYHELVERARAALGALPSKEDDDAA